MSLKCTTADSKSIPYKTTHPLCPFWCWGRGRKSGWSGGGSVMASHSRNHATAHTPPHTHTDKASNINQIAGQTQRPSLCLCAHRATPGTSGRSSFRLSFALRRPRDRRTSAGRTSRKSGRPPGRASGRRPTTEAPYFGRNSPAWAASRRQQRAKTPAHSRGNIASPAMFSSFSSVVSSPMIRVISA